MRREVKRIGLTPFGAVPVGDVFSLNGTDMIKLAPKGNPADFGFWNAATFSGGWCEISETTMVVHHPDAYYCLEGDE